MADTKLEPWQITRFENKVVDFFEALKAMKLEREKQKAKDAGPKPEDYIKA